MQFEDPKSILEAAAAKPSRGVDPHALLKRGSRMRRNRLAAMATGVAVVVVAASASFGMLADGRDDRPGPAAPSPGRCAESSRVSMYLDDDVDTGEARELARMLQRRLRDLNAAFEVEYVSRRQAYRQILRDYREVPDFDWELPWMMVPARLDFLGVDDATIERLRKMLHADVEALGRRTTTAAPEGTCVEVVEGDAPPVPQPPPTRSPRVGPSDARGGALGAVVKLLRAECKTGTIRLVGGPADFVDGTKWCRFVLLVDNQGTRPIRLDLEDQLLRTPAGEGTPPWEEATFDDFSLRLFTSPIPPGRQRMGQAIFLLPPTDVPAALELHPRPGFAPASLLVEYGCAEDLREEPAMRCFLGKETEEVTSRQTWARMDVTLYHCGVDPIVFRGRRWVVPDPPFDATNAPEEFAGTGIFKQRSSIDAVYFDDSGEAIRFEASEDWEPPPCA